MRNANCAECDEMDEIMRNTDNRLRNATDEIMHETDCAECGCDEM